MSHSNITTNIAAADMAPEGAGDAGSPIIVETSIDPVNAANGAGAAGAGAPQGLDITSPTPSLTDVFTIGSVPSSDASAATAPVRGIGIGQANSGGPVTTSMTRYYVANPVSSHAVESDITRSSDGSEAQQSAGGGDGDVTTLEAAGRLRQNINILLAVITVILIVLSVVWIVLVNVLPQHGAARAAGGRVSATSSSYIDSG
jgi:hypothetical protein